MPRLALTTSAAALLLPGLCLAQSGPGPGKAAPEAPSGHYLLEMSLAQRAAGVLLVVALSWLAYRVALGSLRRLIVATGSRVQDTPEAAARNQRAVTVLSLMANVLRWAIFLLGLVWALAAMGVNLLPVLTGVGFLGAAIAFGSQSLVRDVVTGFFILLEGQYAVGDWVDIGGKVGWVQAVGLRTTVLRDQRNMVHHIPNGAIAIATVYGQQALRYRLLAPVADPERAEEAARLLDQVAAGAREQLPALLEAAPAVAYRADSGLSQVALGLSVAPAHEWIATTELPSRVKAALAAAGITAPEGLAPHAESEATTLRAPGL
jgi:small conductance mechanosensitive channel